MPVWTLYPYYRPARLVAGEHLRTGDIQYQDHSQAVTVRSQGHNGSFRRNFLFFFPVESGADTNRGPATFRDMPICRSHGYGVVLVDGMPTWLVIV